MGYRITEKCTSTGTCAKVCPTNSIMMGRDHFVIDTDTCNGCKICVLVCPVDAIVQDDTIGIEDAWSAPRAPVAAEPAEPTEQDKAKAAQEKEKARREENSRKRS